MRLVGHTAGINQVAWSPDGNFIASGGKDGTVWIWDSKTGNVFSTIQMNRTIDSRQANDLEIWSITWSPDGKFLATGGGDGYIRVWKLESGMQTIGLKGHDQYVTYLSWSPFDNHLVSTGSDGKARVWNIEPDTMLLRLPYYSTNAKWSPDGSYIVAAASPDSANIFAGSVSVWNFKTGKLVFETHVDKDENWGWVLPQYTPDGNNIIVRASLPWPDRTDANKYYMLNSQNGEIIKKFDTDKDTMVLIPDFSPDGKLFVVGDYEGTVYFWKVDSGELVRTMDCLSWVHVVDWSPDGRKIAMICIDYEKAINAIQVVDATSFQPLWTVEKDLLEDTYNWLRWSPDSTRIAVGGGNDESGAMENPLYVFDGSNGEETLKITRHTGMIFGIDWSPNGNRLVSGSTDDTIRLWDVGTGAELLAISASVDWSALVDWSPDGKYLLLSILNISGPGQSGVYRVWQTKEELINYAKECCVFRELTDAERTQFGLD
jgi:WD40 repeat protein